MRGHNVMDYLLIRQKVEDYDRWREAYDADLPHRSADGLEERDVFRNSSDPNEVFLLFTIKDLMKARAYLFSEESRAAQRRAGVEEYPSVYFLD